MNMKTPIPITRSANADGSFSIQKRLDLAPLLFGREWAQVSDAECWLAWGHLQQIGWRERPMSAVALIIWQHNKAEPDRERQFVHRRRGAEGGNGWSVWGFLRLVSRDDPWRIYEGICSTDGTRGLQPVTY